MAVVAVAVSELGDFVVNFVLVDVGRGARVEAARRQRSTEHMDAVGRAGAARERILAIKVTFRSIISSCNYSCEAISFYS